MKEKYLKEIMELVQQADTRTLAIIAEYIKAIMGKKK